MVFVVCAVCLEEIYPDRTHVTRLHCGHNFCSKCVSEWQRLAPSPPSCPLCRAPFRGDDFASVAKFQVGLLEMDLSVDFLSTGEESAEDSYETHTS